MKNTTILGSMILFSVAFGIFLFSQDAFQLPQNTLIPPPDYGDEQVQNITLSLKNYNYYPNTIKVKSGTPVSITLDSSVYGCYRSITIDKLRVLKYSLNPQDTIEFIPTQ